MNDSDILRRISEGREVYIDGVYNMYLQEAIRRDLDISESNIEHTQFQTAEEQYIISLGWGAGIDLFLRIWQMIFIAVFSIGFAFLFAFGWVGGKGWEVGVYIILLAVVLAVLSTILMVFVSFVLGIIDKIRKRKHFKAECVRRGLTMREFLNRYM
jgi:hypothetical protein